jgi:uncharacterized protein
LICSKRVAVTIKYVEMNRPKSEDPAGMQIDWDIPIEMDDGVALRADVFRPVGEVTF